MWEMWLEMHRFFQLSLGHLCPADGPSPPMGDHWSLLLNPWTRTVDEVTDHLCFLPGLLFLGFVLFLAVLLFKSEANRLFL